MVVAASSSCSTGGETVDPVDAVVRVRGVACDRPTQGVGVVVDDERVLTSAHVVAGVDEVRIDDRSATVVGFDPNRDLALLVVVGLERPAVDVGSASAGDVGMLVAIDATETVVHHRYEIRRPIRATGEDIYRIEGADRRAFEVDVEFAPGWSGSGMFDDGGRLVGVAFAESRSDPDVTYAVADNEIDAFLGGIDRAADAVDVGPCR